MWFLLLACAPEPTACDCAPTAHETFTVSEAGGFDDWSGAALVWAVDEAAGRALVVATEYPLGQPTYDVAPVCDDPAGLAASWVPVVPEGSADAVERHPVLAEVLTTPAGVRSLTEDVGVLLVEGTSTVERVWVGTGGEATLLRGDGGDGLQGAFDFAASGDALDGEIVEDCLTAFRVPALDLSWGSSGDTE